MGVKSNRRSIRALGVRFISNDSSASGNVRNPAFERLKSSCDSLGGWHHSSSARRCRRCGNLMYAKWL